MTEQEREVLTEAFRNVIKCSNGIIYETLALLFEEIAKHPELTLQQVLVTISMSLRKLAEERK